MLYVLEVLAISLAAVSAVVFIRMARSKNAVSANSRHYRAGYLARLLGLAALFLVSTLFSLFYLPVAIAFSRSH